MFTGLVQGRGTVSSLRPDGAGVRLVLETPADWDAAAGVGDSVAINGCCLTVVEVDGRMLSFEAGPETLAKTNLGRLEPGDPVNLEPALPADGRLGGHFVQGHVDGVGRVERIEREGEWTTMWFGVPPPLARYLVPKGSVAIDGVSLTVVDVDTASFSVALIPHTLELTTFGQREAGDEVNIEIDILAKYVEKLTVANPIAGESGDET